MRVRPRRVYKKLPDGTPLGTQLQISMSVHNSAFMRSAEVVVSAADGSRKRIDYDYRTNNETGERFPNLARFEAPEMKDVTKPVARFQWVDASAFEGEAGKILQYEIFDADSGGEGADILKKLAEGIARPPETNLKKLSQGETVLSKSDQDTAQWYRLDSA
jgi:hypothetical protein